MAAIITATPITRLTITPVAEAAAVLLILLRMEMCIRSKAGLEIFEERGWRGSISSKGRRDGWWVDFCDWSILERNESCPSIERAEIT